MEILIQVILVLCTFTVNVYGKIINKNFCVLDGGMCVQNQTECTGWLEPGDEGCDTLMYCCKPVPLTSHPIPEYPGDTTCGKVTRLQATANPLLRIVGGDLSQEGQWPWQVAIMDAQGNLFCGGTLISTEFVITAAHCFNSNHATTQIVEVILGEHHLVHQTGNEVRMKAKNIIKHAGFRLSDHAHDIAFIQLEKPVNISGHFIRTACLPSKNSVLQPGDICYASGWGYTRGSTDSRELQHIKVDLVSENSCKSSWENLTTITDDKLCAGNGAIGTCQGDSGGPLVCNKNGSYFLVGVTSFGHVTCTQTGFPDVYTRVTSYLDWMTAYMLLLKTAER